MKSLHSFMEAKKSSVAVRISLENFSELPDGKIKILPLYAIHRIFDLI